MFKLSTRTSQKKVLISMTEELNSKGKSKTMQCNSKTAALGASSAAVMLALLFGGFGFFVSFSAAATILGCGFMYFGGLFQRRMTVFVVALHVFLDYKVLFLVDFKKPSFSKNIMLKSLSVPFRPFKKSQIGRKMRKKTMHCGKHVTREMLRGYLK